MKSDSVVNALAKSSAERGNSNLLPVANSSTPILNRAFFVRRLRTPKENNERKNALVNLLSMVGRNGQRLIVGCIPLVAVFHPVTLYRQAWKLAVDVYNLPVEFSTMLYKFLLLGDKRLTIRIRANSEQEARQRLNLSPTNAICIARLKGGIYA